MSAGQGERAAARAPSSKARALLFLLSAAWLTACGGEPERLLHVGDFQVSTSGGRLGIWHPALSGRPLLETHPGEGKFAPVATREGRARVEMLYGSFRFTEEETPWRTAARLERWGDPGAGMELAALDGAGTPVATLSLRSPGAGVLRLELRAQDAAHQRTSLSLACDPGEHFLGFGAQSDALEHRGHDIPIWTSEQGIGKTDSDGPSDLWMLEGSRHSSSMGLPVWHSSRGYVGVLESDRRSLLQVCSEREDALRLETWDGRLVLWLHVGPTPAEALERATGGLLGRPPRPPPIAFAPWLDGLYGSEAIRALAKRLRGEGIPSSVIWTEDFRGGGPWGDVYGLKGEWAVDGALYPDIEGLNAELREQGFAHFAYFNTFIEEGTSVHAEAMAGGHLVQRRDGSPYLFRNVGPALTGLADLSRPQTREWVKGYLRRALDQGFTGWMADFAEWLPHDAKLHSGEDPMAAHNRYPLEWTRLNHEVLAERAGDDVQRLFFTRSGWLGSGALAPVMWAGDQRTSFQRDDGLYTVLPLGLNLGLSGVSTYGHDIAGYQSATNPPSTKELFFRWTSLGALSPVMRTHHGLSAGKNWWFGADEETLAHFRRWASFHIRLFPYLDGGSKLAERRGLPLMRALPLEFPEWAPAWTQSEQYLLGPSLLVAPVLEEGAQGRVVQLPPGEWVNLSSGERLSGNRDVTAPAPPGELPLFGRAGGLVPLLPAGVKTLLSAAPPTVDLEDVADRRELWVFPGAPGRFEERDGTAYVLALAPASQREGVFAGAGATALPACGSAEARGCVAPGEVPGSVRVRLEGAGPLRFSDHELTVEGSARVLDVVIFP